MSFTLLLLFYSQLAFLVLIVCALLAVRPATAKIIGIATSNVTCPVADIIIMYAMIMISINISYISLHTGIYSPYTVLLSTRIVIPLIGINLIVDSLCLVNLNLTIEAGVKGIVSVISPLSSTSLPVSRVSL